MTQLGDRFFRRARQRPVLTIAVIAVMIIIVVFLSGCAQQRLGLELYDPDVYRRAEVDAINAEMQCKQTARNSLDMARCTGNRRGP
jgi:outer membrane lipoprotein-sorting protein